MVEIRLLDFVLAIIQQPCSMEDCTACPHIHYGMDLPDDVTWNAMLKSVADFDYQKSRDFEARPFTWNGSTQNPSQ